MWVCVCYAVHPSYPSFLSIYINDEFQIPIAMNQFGDYHNGPIPFHSVNVKFSYRFLNFPSCRWFSLLSTPSLSPT